MIAVEAWVWWEIGLGSNSSHLPCPHLVALGKSPSLADSLVCKIKLIISISRTVMKIKMKGLAHSRLNGSYYWWYYFKREWLIMCSLCTLCRYMISRLDHQSWGAIWLILSVEDWLTGSLCYLGRGYETLKQNAMTSWTDDKADVWVHPGMNKLWIMEGCCLKASSCMLKSRWPSCWSE